MRRTATDKWITSKALAHPALIGAELFELVQCELRDRGERARRQRAVTARSYALAGLVTRELCGRLMAGTWTNQQTYYRCRAIAPYQGGHPANVYLRENDLVTRIHTWIKSHIDPTHLLGLEDGAANAAFRALGLSATYNSGDKTLVVATVESRDALTLHAGSLI